MASKRNSIEYLDHAIKTTLYPYNIFILILLHANTRDYSKIRNYTFIPAVLRQGIFKLRIMALWLQILMVGVLFVFKSHAQTGGLSRSLIIK